MNPRSWEVWEGEVAEKLVKLWGYPRKTPSRRDDLMKKAGELCMGETVLDAGCGYGHLWYYLPGNVNYLGIDISEDMLKIAKELNPKATFQLGDIYDLSKFGVFDTVYAISVLIHLPSTYRPLEELWGHTRKAVIFSMYIDENKFEIRTEGRDGIKYGSIIYRHQTEKDLQRVFDKLGIPTVEAYSFDNPELNYTKIFRLRRE